MQCLGQQIQDLHFKINAREILFDKDLENQISITQLITLFRKTQCNCVLIKVLLDFFQKIAGCGTEFHGFNQFDKFLFYTKTLNGKNAIKGFKSFIYL